MNEPPFNPIKPRLVECAACGTRARLVMDTKDAVELPHGWQRMGHRRDGSSIIYCKACVYAERKS